MSSAKGAGSAVNVVCGILVFLILLGVVGFFGIFTKWFKKPVATFYLKYGNELFIGDCETEFSHESTTLEVKYLLGAIEANTEYTIKIEANAEEDFTFKVGKTEYKYSEIEDLTSAFEIRQEDGSFTLNLKALTNMEELLGKLYYGNVVMDEDVYFDDGKPFILTVTSGNGEEVRLKFGVAKVPVERVDLSEAEVVFG